jgi:hypothetical protein
MYAGIMTPRMGLFTLIASTMLFTGGCGGKALSPTDGTGGTGGTGGNGASGASQGSTSGANGSMHSATTVGAGFTEATAMAALGPALFLTTKATVEGGVPTRNGGLFMVPKSGGDALLLAEDHRGAAYTDLAFDDGTILVGTSDGRVIRVPQFGGASTEIVSGSPPIVALAADANHVFFAHAKGAVLSVDKNGSNPTVVASPGGSVRAVTLAGDQLYVAYDDGASGALLRVTTTTLESTTVAKTTGALSGLSVGADFAYMSNTEGSVFAAKLQGGAVSSIAHEQPSPCGVAADATSVYWIATEGANLWRANAAGDAAEAIAVVDDAVTSPHAVAVDDSAIYVLTQTQVVRVGK